MDFLSAISPEILERIREELIRKKDLTPAESLKQCAPLYYPQKRSAGGDKKSFRHDLISIQAVSVLVKEVYEDITPLELAKGLKEVVSEESNKEQQMVNGILAGFATLSASELAAVLLNPEIYPELSSKPLETATCIKNNEVTTYDEGDIKQCLAENFPSLSQLEIGEIINKVFHKEPDLPIKRWAGVYSTHTEYWGNYFDPLIIEENGTMSMQGVKINYQFHAASQKLVFSLAFIGVADCRGEFTFSIEAGRKVFNGIMFPRRVDGPVGFSGKAS